MECLTREEIVEELFCLYRAELPDQRLYDRMLEEGFA